MRASQLCERAMPAWGPRDEFRCESIEAAILISG